jgi:predicted anti-sigma-YlaC factor YlaD
MSVHDGKFGCNEMEPELQKLLFGELDEAEKPAVVHHLGMCSRCRAAFEDAEAGLDALAALEEAPLPYNEAGAVPADPDRSSVEWTEFQQRLQRGEQKKTARWSSLYKVAAAAAFVLVGFGLGRVGTTSQETIAPENISETLAELDTLRVEPAAVEALARAEILSDLGRQYVDGLDGLITDVMAASVGNVTPTELALTRERARELIRDGRLLRRSLDSERDGSFISAINRAELFLEELAAVQGNGAGTSVRIVQASLRDSRLSDQFAALDLDKEVTMALAASGWIGEELVQRKEF